MLAEILDDFEVVNSVGEKYGKVKDVYFDIDKWIISGFEVSPGFFKRDVILELDDIIEIRDEQKLIVVKDDYEAKDTPKNPSRTLFPFGALKSKKVVDSQNDKVGSIYNMEIPFSHHDRMKVWKVLIRTGFKERRLRLRPLEIVSVMDEIKLSKTLDEYQGKMD